VRYLPAPRLPPSPKIHTTSNAGRLAGTAAVQQKKGLDEYLTSRLVCASLLVSGLHRRRTWNFRAQRIDSRRVQQSNSVAKSAAEGNICGPKWLHRSSGSDAALSVRSCGIRTTSSPTPPSRLISSRNFLTPRRVGYDRHRTSSTHDPGSTDDDLDPSRLMYDPGG
jgi:hypothetical protein